MALASGDDQPARQPTTARRWLRRGVLAVAAAIMLIGLFAEGRTVRHHHHPHSAGALAQGGTFRVEERRSQQTFDDRPNPQHPDVTSWWAVRPSCTPNRCLAAAIPLSDNDHAQAKSPGAHPMILEFGDGQWRSRPENVTSPCVALSGSPSTQGVTRVLSLRPQPHDELSGEMVLTVIGDECGQRGGVIRIPAVAARSGDSPPGVEVPDPANVDH